jgi:hypothetical protein
MTGQLSPLLRVHRRQFVVGPSEFLARPDWRRVELEKSCVVSIDPEARVGQVTDLDGVPWLLIGVAVDTRPERSDPLTELQRRRTKEVPSLYEGWSGRWALIGAGSLHPDAAALLGCYYGRNPEGEVWASSSPALIRRVVGVEAAGPSRERENAWAPAPVPAGGGGGISWFPPPHSGIPGVYRLLPSQTLVVRDGSPLPRRLVRVDAGLDQAGLVAEIAVALRTALERLAALVEPDELTLLLSGGRDSRVLLSIAAAAGLNVKTYTRIHRRATLADRLLPPRLSGAVGYPHRFHRQVRELPERRQAILEHAGYNLSWLSAEEFLGGGSDPLTGIALNGICQGLGRTRLLPDVPLEEVSGAVIARRFREEDNPTLTAALDAWLAWRREHPDPAFDLSDAFYVEQRLAGRKGAKEQLCDLFRFERVPPFNSSRIFSLVMQFEPEARKQAIWIPEVIRSHVPELLGDPMNPPDSYFGIVRRLLDYNAHRRRLIPILRPRRRSLV